MDKPIQVGDLVQIVKPTPCGCTGGLGMMFVVKEIDRSAGLNGCYWCGHLWAPEDQAHDGHTGASLWRLKRIPPLDELESEKRDEEITA